MVDAAMVDGSALLATMIHEMAAAGAWAPERGSNLLDTGAPFYDVYGTADGGYVAVGALEPQFYAELLARLGFDLDELPAQMDRSSWPGTKERFAALFKTKSRDEWSELLEGSDACFAPVLSMAEAPGHPHLRARNTFVEIAGVTQPGPAPRFSRTVPEVAGPPPHPGQHSKEILRELGIDDAEVGRLYQVGAVR